MSRRLSHGEQALLQTIRERYGPPDPAVFGRMLDQAREIDAGWRRYHAEQAAKAAQEARRPLEAARARFFAEAALAAEDAAYLEKLQRIDQLLELGW